MRAPCLVLSGVAALCCPSVLRAVLWYLALLCCGLLRAVWCLLGCLFLCCAALLVPAACCAVSLVVLSGWVVRGVCLLPGVGLRSRVARCAVCPWMRCCGALLLVVPPGVVLLCAVLFCCACLVSLLVVPSSPALPVALGPCALRRCVSRCSPALCALCCVFFVVACWCALLFAAVLCAVCVLGCRAVRTLSSPLCAVLCPLAQGGNHLAMWKPEDTIAQHAGWGHTAPPGNEVQRLMRQPEFKEVVLRGAVPLQLLRLIADHAPRPKATVRQMQLSAVKRADTQRQHRVQLYTQEAQQASDDHCMYYNVLIHYQPVQPSD